MGDEQHGLLVSRWMRCSSTFMRSRVMASSAPNGSSISTIFGSCTSARQIEARCCMPPDNCQGYLFSKPSSPTILMQRRRAFEYFSRQALDLDRHHHVAEYARATAAAARSGTRCRRRRAGSSRPALRRGFRLRSAAAGPRSSSAASTFRSRTARRRPRTRPRRCRNRAAAATAPRRRASGRFSRRPSISITGRVVVDATAAASLDTSAL